VAQNDHSDAVSAGPPVETRRPFLISFLAGFIGAVVGIVPVAAGGFAYLSPIFRKKNAGGPPKIRVASLSGIPEDGQPMRFPIIAARDDAWSRYPPAPIGSVYLRRVEGQDKPECFSATCPHLGCMVDFKSDSQEYRCPCHNSYFTVDGDRINPASCPSPRDLDKLEVEVDGSDVYVLFKRFRGGIETQQPE
jgi:Rieske Fe-S protein